VSANDFDSPATIALATIRPADDNLRVDLGDLTSLRSSIRAHGVLQPLLLAPLDPTIIDLDADGKAYRVVDGHRRYAAAVAEGLTDVPALVRRTMSDTDRVEAMLTTALEKRDLLPSEEAAGYARLVALGRSQRDIAALAGVNQSHISKTLKLADLPEKARAAVDSGRITREQGQALAGLPAKKVAEMFKGNQMPDHWEIADEVSKAERAAKQEAAEKEATTAGLKVFGPSQVGYNLNNGAPVWLTCLRQDGRSGCTPDEHAVKSCHAVAYGGTGMQPACTDPASHPAKPEAKPLHAKTRTPSAGGITVREVPYEEWPDRAQRDAEDSLRRAMAASDEIRRKAFMRQLVEAPRPVDVTTLAGSILPDLSDVQLADAVELLPVDTDDWDQDCLSDHLADWAGADPARRQFRHLQVVYAIALAEAAAYGPGRHHDTWALRLQSAFWDHLTAHGYVLSDLERSWLPEAEAEAEPAAEVVAPEDLDAPLDQEFIDKVQAERDAPCSGCGGPRDSAAIRHHHPTCGTCDRDRIAREAMEAELAKPPEYVEGISESTADDMHDVAGAEAADETAAAGDDDEGFTAQSICNIGIGDQRTWSWECDCGATSGDTTWPTGEQSDEALDAHMVTVHGRRSRVADA